MVFNHHSAGLLPYFVHPKGGLTFILEQKDPKYKSPFFDSGLNFEGGNCEKGLHPDKNPKETLVREVSEEFWAQYEAPESLNTLLGQEFITREPDVVKKYDERNVRRIQQAVPLLTEGMEYVISYRVSVNPPITKTPLQYASSIFAKQLSEGEFSQLEAMIKEFDGRLTTDNLKWGGRIVAVSLSEINNKNMKFSWGYDHIVNDMLPRLKILRQPHGVLRTMSDLVKIEVMQYLESIRIPFDTGPTYEDTEKSGYQYLDKKK